MAWKGRVTVSGIGICKVYGSLFRERDLSSIRESERIWEMKRADYGTFCERVIVSYGIAVSMASEARDSSFLELENR